MNLIQLKETRPHVAKHMNMVVVDAKYADLLASKDIHAPSRSFNEDSAMLKKVTHNYTQQIRVVADKKQGRDNAIRNSAITMISEVRPYTDERDVADRKHFNPNDGTESVAASTFYKD